MPTAGAATLTDVRVALVAETFTPAVNGVVNSVLRVADELTALGHEPVVVAPSGEDFRTRSGDLVPVVGVPSLNLPGYRGLSVARPAAELSPILADLGVDVVHLASPVLLGWRAVRAANELGLPSVAVFQTDLSAFLHRYHLGAGSSALWHHLRRLHNSADLTLVPSTATSYLLRRHGIGPLALWSRGVDNELFNPARRDEQVRRTLLGPAVSRTGSSTGGHLLVGFVGRLAPEKRVELLEPLSRVPGVRLVIIGDGPRREALEELMPGALFLGQRTGADLGALMAALDLFVHPGADETFCQVVQEALCAGVPVITAAAGGPLDLVRHGENGWLWGGGDPEVLAAQVEAVREDRPGLAEVQSRTRSSVVGRTWSRITDELIGHYQWAIDRRVTIARPLTEGGAEGGSEGGSEGGQVISLRGRLARRRAS